MKELSKYIEKHTKSMNCIEHSIQKGIKTKETHMKIGEDGLNGYQRIASVARPKQLETMAKAGLRIFSTDRNEWKLYRHLVDWLTNVHKKEILNNKKTGKMGTTDAYQIDHLYSVLNGFRNKVSPYLIADKSNLALVRWEDNSSKKHKNGIELEDLYEKTNYTKETSEQEFLDFIHVISVAEKEKFLTSAIVNADILKYQRLRVENQNLKKNNLKYEILTPHGWEDFNGVIKNNTPRISRELITEHVVIQATVDHKFYSNGVVKRTIDFKIGDILDTEYGSEKIIKINETILENTFEIFNTTSHTVIANATHSHQCDELSYVSPNIQKAFITSVVPTLSTGGSCIVTSTPRTDEDQFAQIWKGAIDITDEFGNPNETKVGKNGWYAVEVAWYEHPDRDEEWARPLRETLGEARFLQENENKFLSDEETLINPMCLKRLTDRAKNPIFYVETTRWYSEPKSNKGYMVTLDPCHGTGGDFAAIQVFQIPEMIQVAEWSHNNTNPRGQVRVLMQTLVFIDETLRNFDDQMGEPEIYWTVENNGVGEAILTVIEHTGEDRFPGTFVSDRRRAGSKVRKGMFTSRSKAAECARLKSLIESDRMILNSKNLVKELKSYVASENSFKAKQGEHDDLVSSTLLIIKLLDYVMRWEDKNTNGLREYIDENELMEIAPLPIVI